MPAMLKHCSNLVCLNCLSTLQSFILPIQFCLLLPISTGHRLTVLLQKPVTTSNIRVGHTSHQPPVTKTNGSETFRQPLSMLMMIL